MSTIPVILFLARLIKKVKMKIVTAFPKVIYLQSIPPCSFLLKIPKQELYILSELQPFINVDIILVLQLKTLSWPLTMVVFTGRGIAPDGQS